MICPVCEGSKSELFDQDKHRAFFKCLECDLVYVPRSSLVTASEEKARYDSHENSEEDDGYRKYLAEIAEVIKAQLFPGELGLDFGCGKTTMLEKLLAPFEVTSYDLFYHPNQQLLEKKYNFIILSEVVEHLREPRQTMLSLKESLLPGGKIFVKTKLRPENSAAFSQWFYKRDITHIQFFNENSFNVLKDICQLKGPEFLGQDLFLFRSP
jgi:hypothetical protein